MVHCTSIYIMYIAGLISPMVIPISTAHLILLPSGAGKLATASIRTVGMLWPPNPPCFQINFQVLSFPHIPSTWTVVFTQCSLEWRLLLLTIHSPLMHRADQDMDIHLDKRSCVSTPPNFFLRTPRLHAIFVHFGSPATHAARNVLVPLIFATTL
jgi:hypothetical protein